MTILYLSHSISIDFRIFTSRGCRFFYRKLKYHIAVLAGCLLDLATPWGTRAKMWFMVNMDRAHPPAPLSLRF